MTILSIDIHIDTGNAFFGDPEEEDFEFIKATAISGALRQLSRDFLDRTLSGGLRRPSSVHNGSGAYVGEVSYKTSLDFWLCVSCGQSFNEREYAPRQCLSCGSKEFSIIETRNQFHLLHDQWVKERNDQKAAEEVAHANEEEERRNEDIATRSAGDW